ncbi:SUMO-specific isopeptidase USPL1 isoform X1 [Lampetra planeri]
MAAKRFQMLSPCPMCTKNGKTSFLRRFFINFSESISLCEDALCIYPLGYFPIGRILTKASAQKHRANARRRMRTSVEDIQTLGSPIKQTRACGDFSEQNLPKDIPPLKKRINCAQSVDISKTREVRGGLGGSSEESDGCPSRTRGIDEHSEGSHGGRLDLEIPAQLSEHSYSRLRTENDQRSEEDAAQPPWMYLAGRVLQWQNKYALCWLDCILMVLVHSRSVQQRFLQQSRICAPKGSVGISQECFVQTLLTQYNQAQAMLATTLQSGGLPEGHRARGAAAATAAAATTTTAPVAESLAATAAATATLHGVRMTVFSAMQPRLKCQLGKNESPVFALPLLLRESQELEELFLQSFSWETHCHACLKESRRQDSSCLVTFPSVVSDWHPLNATHLGTCSHCQAKGQRRRLHWHRLAPVTVMHFEMGMAHGDMDKYSFTHQGAAYAVSAFIQYRTHPDHFIAWIRSQNGTWLECDDLNGPFCVERKEVSVPPEQLHVVFWETVASADAEGGRTSGAEPGDFRQNHGELGSQAVAADARADRSCDVEDLDIPDRRRESERCDFLRGDGRRDERRVHFADCPAAMSESCAVRAAGLCKVPGTRPDWQGHNESEGVHSARGSCVPRDTNEQIYIDQTVGMNSNKGTHGTSIDKQRFPVSVESGTAESECNDDAKATNDAGNVSAKSVAISPVDGALEPAVKNTTDEAAGKCADKTSPQRRHAANVAIVAAPAPRSLAAEDCGKFHGCQLRRDRSPAPIADACPEMPSERGAPGERVGVTERRPAGDVCGGRGEDEREACWELHSLLKRLGRRRRRLASVDKFITRRLLLEEDGGCRGARCEGTGPESSPPQQTSTVRKEQALSEGPENVQTERQGRLASRGALTEPPRPREQRHPSDVEHSPASEPSEKCESPHRFYMGHVSAEGCDGNVDRHHACNINNVSTEGSDEDLEGHYLTPVYDASVDLLKENSEESPASDMMDSSTQDLDETFGGTHQILREDVPRRGAETFLSEDHPAIAGHDYENCSDGNLEDQHAFNVTQASTEGHHEHLQEYLLTLVEYLPADDPNRNLEGFYTCGITRPSAEGNQEMLQGQHATVKERVSAENLDQNSEAIFSHNVLSLETQDYQNPSLVLDTSINPIDQILQRAPNESQIVPEEVGTRPDEWNENRALKPAVWTTTDDDDDDRGASEPPQSDSEHASTSEGASGGQSTLGKKSSEGDKNPGRGADVGAGGRVPKTKATSASRGWGGTERARAPSTRRRAAALPAPALQRFREKALRLQLLAGEDSARFGGYRPREKEGAPVLPKGSAIAAAGTTAVVVVAPLGSGEEVALEPALAGECGERVRCLAVEPQEGSLNLAQPRGDSGELKALLKRLERRKQQLAMVEGAHRK